MEPLAWIPRSVRFVDFLFWEKGPNNRYESIVWVRQVSNIRRTLGGNWIVDRSDVVRASTVGAAQLHLHFPLNTHLQYIAQRQLQAETRNIWILGIGTFILEILR